MHSALRSSTLHFPEWAAERHPLLAALLHSWVEQALYTADFQIAPPASRRSANSSGRTRGRLVGSDAGEDLCRHPLNRSKRLGEGFSGALVELDVVLGCGGGNEANGVRHHEGDGLGFGFSHGLGCRPVAGLVKELVSKLVREYRELFCLRETGLYANASAAGDTQGAGWQVGGVSPLFTKRPNCFQVVKPATWVAVGRWERMRRTFPKL